MEVHHDILHSVQTLQDNKVAQDSDCDVTELFSTEHAARLNVF